MLHVPWELVFFFEERRNPIIRRRVCARERKKERKQKRILDTIFFSWTVQALFRAVEELSGSWLPPPPPPRRHASARSAGRTLSVLRRAAAPPWLSAEAAARGARRRRPVRSPRLVAVAAAQLHRRDERADRARHRHLLARRPSDRRGRPQQPLRCETCRRRRCRRRRARLSPPPPSPCRRLVPLAPAGAEGAAARERTAALRRAGINPRQGGGEEAPPAARSARYTAL